MDNEENLGVSTKRSLWVSTVSRHGECRFEWMGWQGKREWEVKTRINFLSKCQVARDIAWWRRACLKIFTFKLRKIGENLYVDGKDVAEENGWRDSRIRPWRLWRIRRQRRLETIFVKAGYKPLVTSQDYDGDVMVHDVKVKNKPKGKRMAKIRVFPLYVTFYFICHFICQPTLCLMLAGFNDIWGCLCVIPEFAFIT